MIFCWPIFSSFESLVICCLVNPYIEIKVTIETRKSDQRSPFKRPFVFTLTTRLFLGPLPHCVLVTFVIFSLYQRRRSHNRRFWWGSFYSSGLWIAVCLYGFFIDAFTDHVQGGHRWSSSSITRKWNYITFVCRIQGNFVLHLLSNKNNACILYFLTYFALVDKTKKSLPQVLMSFLLLRFLVTKYILQTRILSRSTSRFLFLQGNCFGKITQIHFFNIWATNLCSICIFLKCEYSYQ